MLKLLSFQPQHFSILVVDDSSTNLKIVGQMLKDAGYETSFATQGKQVMQQVKQARPDLILLDLMMPDMSGMSVCQQLQAHPEYHNIPVIFLTASQAQEHILEAFQIGAVDYVTKPFQKLELLARIKTHLLLKHTTDQLKQTSQKLQIALEKAERLSQVDPLTNVSNRRYFFEQAELEYVRSQRYNLVFSALMIDIDHFKAVNDSYGHQVGDQVISGVAQALAETLRQVDLIGRYGGEEFALLLPETPLIAAATVGERLRQRTAKLTFPVKSKPTQPHSLTAETADQASEQTSSLQVTISVGIAESHKADSRIDDVLERADQALYQAKANGRNQCCSAS
ncbi:MAG: diguanylate cyclase [Thainema sp.]